MNGTLSVEMLETRAVLAIGEARAAPCEAASAARAEAVKRPKRPITLA